MEDLVPFYAFLKDVSDDICLIQDVKSVYRNLKRIKKISKDKISVLYEFEDDELSLISAVLKRNKFIVWRPTICKKYYGQIETSDIRLLCADKEGVWLCKESYLRKLLLEEKDKIMFLTSWQEDQERARATVKKMIQIHEKENLDLLKGGELYG